MGSNNSQLKSVHESLKTLDESITDDKSPSSFPSTRREAIDALFKESYLYHLNTSDWCSKCGHGTSYDCKCAKKNFIHNLPEEKIQAYLNRDPNWKISRLPDIERAWNMLCDRRKKNIERYGSIICKSCDIKRENILKLLISSINHNLAKIIYEYGAYGVTDKIICDCAYQKFVDSLDYCYLDMTLLYKGW